MVVWLQTISSSEVALSTCHNYLFIFSSTVSHIRSPLYSRINILKAYEIQFHPVQNQDYWSPYTGLIYDT